MALETIYSVGEGRTVVVAVDGCLGCLNAFEEFVRDKAEPEDRIVAVVKGGRPKLPEGKFSGPLLLSGTPKAMAMSLLSGQRPQSPATGGNRRPAEREDCKVRNRVIVPGKPLSDFADWDKTSKSILTKLAQRAEQTKTRFEALRVLAGSRPNLWVEAVMECCNELEADLLVVASHKQPKGPHARSLSAVFSVNPKCPVLVLGKKTPREATVPPEEEEEEDSEKHGNLLQLRRTSSTISKTLSKSASFAPTKESQNFPQPKNKGAVASKSQPQSSAGHERRSSDDSDLPAGTYAVKPKARASLTQSRSFLVRREASAPAKMQKSGSSTLAQKWKQACQKAVDKPMGIISGYLEH